MVFLQEVLSSTRRITHVVIKQSFLCHSDCRMKTNYLNVQKAWPQRLQLILAYRRIKNSDTWRLDQRHLPVSDLSQTVSGDFVYMQDLRFSQPCDVTPCQPTFRKKCRPHLQGRRISSALLATCFHVGSFFGLFFDHEHAPPKRRLTFNRLHDVISQNIRNICFCTCYGSSFPSDSNAPLLLMDSHANSDVIC
jgi:hypothetical protein